MKDQFLSSHDGCIGILVEVLTCLGRDSMRCNLCPWNLGSQRASVGIWVHSGLVLQSQSCSTSLYLQDISAALPPAGSGILPGGIEHCFMQMEQCVSTLHQALHLIGPTSSPEDRVPPATHCAVVHSICSTLPS